MYNVQPPTLWVLSIGQNSLKHREIWFLAGVSVYVRVRAYVLDEPRCLVQQWNSHISPLFTIFMEINV